MLNKKKHLCVLLPQHWACEFGGAEYQAKCLIDAVDTTGQFKVTYIAGSTNPEYKTKKYNIINIGASTKLRRYSIIFDAFKLYKTLVSISPDIIYQRVGCAYTGVAAYYAKKYSCEMIWHIARDTDLLPFDKDITFKSIFKYIDYSLLKYGVKNSPKIVAQTNLQDKLLLSRFGRKANLIVPNFHHNPVEKIEKKEPLKVVWVANLKPYKRPEVFIDLANACKDIKNVEFVMIGKPQAIGEWIERLMMTINQAKNIKYISNASFDQVNEVLAQSHIFVNTSKYEGFPNTFIQSWMRKVAIVSLNINPDGVLDNKEIGICSGTYDQLVEDVKHLVLNNDLRTKMANNAYTYVFKKHSMDNARNIIDLMH